MASLILKLSSHLTEVDLKQIWLIQSGRMSGGSHLTEVDLKHNILIYPLADTKSSHLTEVDLKLNMKVNMDLFSLVPI